MSATSLEEEFLALANLVESLDVPSQQGLFYLAMNKLRRNSIKLGRTESNLLHAQAQKLVSWRWSDKADYAPLEDGLLLLEHQLLTLVSSLPSGGCLGVASQVDGSLNLLKSYFHALRLSPQLDNSPDDPYAFTAYRACHLRREFRGLFRRLSLIFSSCWRIFDLNHTHWNGNIAATRIRPGELLDKINDAAYRVASEIPALIHTLHQPTYKMWVAQWTSLRKNHDKMLANRVAEQRGVMIQNSRRKELLCKRITALILLIKLSRLTMSKIHTWTYQVAHLGLPVPLEKLELLQKEMEEISEVHIARLHNQLNLTNRPPGAARNRIFFVTQQFLESLQYIRVILESHLNGLNPSGHHAFILRMLTWCAIWNKSFSIALHRFLRLF